MIVLWLVSCKTTRTIAENKVENSRQSVQEVTRIDSVLIFERDSIFVKIGKDTVWLEKYVYRFRDRVIRDTFYFTDTVILKQHEFVTEIEKPPLWGRITNATLWLVVGIILGIIIRILLKKMV